MQLIAEYNSAGALLRRHVPGVGLDDVIATVEGTDRLWLVDDERGSVIALTDSSAALASRNTYDEYGQPGPTSAGRFQYTGQVWLPEARVYHYRARAYAPALGRFMQTDPIGYEAGLNLYNYVGADPINWTDPMGPSHVTIGPRRYSICYETDANFGIDGVSRCSQFTSMGGGSSSTLYSGRWSGGESIYSAFPGSGFGNIPIQSDPQYERFRTAYLDASRENWWLAIPALAPAVAIVGIEAGASALAVQVGSRIPFRPNSLTHIFVNKTGHWGGQTATQMRQIQNVATPRNFVRSDRHGNSWYFSRDASTNQIWARVNNGSIVSGGRNFIPR